MVKAGSPGGSNFLTQVLWKMGVSSGWGEGTSEGLWAGGALGGLEMEGPHPETGGRSAESRPGPQPVGKHAPLTSRPTWWIRVQPE